MVHGRDSDESADAHLVNSECAPNLIHELEDVILSPPPARNSDLRARLRNHLLRAESAPKPGPPPSWEQTKPFATVPLGGSR